MAIRGQQTPVMSQPVGSSTCPPFPHRLLETTLTLGTKEAALIFIAVRRSLNTANAEGMRWGGDMKYGGGMGSPDLYQYLVEHSYRPNEHLDALHKVTLTACVLNWPRR